MVEETLKATGSVVILVHDAAGVLKDERRIDNLVVTAGKNLIAERMLDVPTKDAISHVAVGTGTTAAAAANTTLQTEAARVAIATAVRSGNTVTYTANIPAGTGTATLAEAGLLNDAVAGDLLARTTFAPVVKGASDTMSVTWNVQLN